MADPVFVHLRLHSEYSISDGIVRIDDAVARATKDAMPALALTDLNNLFAAVKFYKAARAKGLKPVLGCDVWIANPANRDQPSRLLLLCRNAGGYRILCELISRAFTDNQYRGRAEIDKEWLRSHHEGLLALSGGAQGDIGRALLQGQGDVALEAAQHWSKIFPGAFYIELQRTGLAERDGYVDNAVALASQLQLPVVATHPIQFLDGSDFKAHEARVCIAEGYVLGDRRRRKEFTEEQYFKTQAQMAELFADLPQALANTVEIAKRCNLELELGKNRLPDYPTPKGISLDDYLLQQAQAGLARRLELLYPNYAERDQQRPTYVGRLEFEAKTIIQMGFAGYFLIVADFINWAKMNGVPVGPGRGSGAGSLVAYSLGITDLDPLRYNLLFERFLNPERVSMPDFDIDFCQNGRDRVIDYVRNKYGAQSVSQIATFGTMAAKAAVRDIGRVLDLGYNFCDGIAKLIPFQPGKTITLQMALEMEPLLKERYEKEEEVSELLALAERVEGLTRNVGMHAGGVLIAPGNLTDYCPIYVAEGASALVSQFDKDDVEAIGLVKFDFLGLTTLTILDWAAQDIRALSEQYRDFSLETLPLDDRATYEILKTANTVAVFQLESRGMKDMLLRAKPDRFEDIIALVALYRPGPMELIPDFCERKHGKRFDYPDPRVAPILSETYGIMVYQEQVMQMAQILGGYSLGGADLLRRAMGKKKPEEMATHREIFREGAQKNGLSQAKADEIFDLMEKFAGYGFNKSHAAAYALLAYQTAYLKAHFPSAFMAANMSAAMDDTDKVQSLFEDCVANKIKILPPDVNLGDYRFVPTGATEIRYGLGAVKGTGEAAISHMVAARKANGPFKDLFDFCRRIDKRTVNRRAIESLVRAGAFDALHPDRGQLLANVGNAIEAAEQLDRNAGQASLFGDSSAQSESNLSLQPGPRWDEREKLQNEKLALGLYLSGHPFSTYRQELAPILKHDLAALRPQFEALLLGGIVQSVRVQQTRRGRMGAVMLDDGTAKVEVAIFNEVWEQHRTVIKEDQLLLVEGKIVEDAFSGGVRITADRVMDLAAARATYAKRLRIELNGQADAKRLAAILRPHMPGNCPVLVAYETRGARCEIDVGKAKLNDVLIASLHDWLSTQNVSIVY